MQDAKWAEELRFDLEDDCSPDPCQDDRFHGDHRNDQGERTNKKLRVQPFYQRARDGKMKRF